MQFCLIRDPNAVSLSIFRQQMTSHAANNNFLLLSSPSSASTEYLSMLSTLMRMERRSDHPLEMSRTEMDLSCRQRDNKDRPSFNSSCPILDSHTKKSCNNSFLPSFTFQSFAARARQRYRKDHRRVFVWKLKAIKLAVRPERSHRHRSGLHEVVV